MYSTASSFVVASGAKKIYQHKNQFDDFHEFVMQRVGYGRGKYLEIGAGGGALLNRFRQMKYECYGVDPGQWVKDESIVSNIDDLPRNLKFDLFVLQDVLEHVLDPVALMKNLRTLAKPDSAIFCSFPSCDSRPARRYGASWAMVRPFGHLHYFSHHSSTRMFAAAGWRLLEFQLSYITSIKRLLQNLKLKEIGYQLIKGGRDQSYIMGLAR